MQKSGVFYLSSIWSTMFHAGGKLLISCSWQSPLARSVPEGDCREFFQGPISNAQPMECPIPLTATSTYYSVWHDFTLIILHSLAVSGDSCLPLAPHTREIRTTENRTP